LAFFGEEIGIGRRVRNNTNNNKIIINILLLLLLLLKVVGRERIKYDGSASVAFILKLWWSHTQ